VTGAAWSEPPIRSWSAPLARALRWLGLGVLGLIWLAETGALVVDGAFDPAAADPSRVTIVAAALSWWLGAAAAAGLARGQVRLVLKALPVWCAGAAGFTTLQLVPDARRLEPLLLALLAPLVFAAGRQVARRWLRADEPDRPDWRRNPAAQAAAA